MPINESDIVVGGVYRTPGNQERVVLTSEHGMVKYSSRGGNVKNGFDHMDECKSGRFAEACSERIEDISSEEFDKIRDLFQSRGLI